MQTILDCFAALAPKIAELITYGETSYTSNTNQSGDIQLALDIQSDLLIQEHLSKLPNVKAIFSEEKEDVLSVNAEGKYLVAYDPIDGSSLIGGNLSVGTIFGIYEESFEGKNLKASGYILYGPRLEMVVARDRAQKPKFWRYNPREDKWDFQGELSLRGSGNINATGGSQKFWSKEHREIINHFFSLGYRLRYSGGMVPDLHQILIKQGGLFSYPATQDHPSGKLRKLFEVFPFAFVFECAGGEAIDGERRLLDLPISHSHESSPCFFGSKEEIEFVKRSLNARK